MKSKSLLILSVILSIVLVMGALTGCGTQKAGNNQSEAPQTTQAATEKPADTFIVTDKPITLSFWVIPDARITATLKNYGEIAMYKELEKRTNVSIDWIHPVAAQATEQFNLMVASGELPDMIMNTWFNLPGGPAKAIADGTIIKLNDLMAENAPNLNKIYSEHPEWKKMAILDDGTQYMFPFIRSELITVIGGGFQVRKDYLDKLGLKVPANIDEFHDMLVAFRDNDPNGNGLKDEIPFVGVGDTTNISKLTRFLGAFGLLNDFCQENGKAKFGPMDPGYKEWLKTMSAWYSEGLINKEYLSTDGAKMDQLVTSGVGCSFWGQLSGIMGKYLSLMRPKDPTFDLQAVPVLKGPGGIGGGFIDHGPSGPQKDGAVAITSKCKYPNEAARWLDYKYSPEGQLLTNFGIEGESYTMVDGKPVYTDKVLKNPDLPFTNAVSQYCLESTQCYFYRGDSRRQDLGVMPELVKASDVWGTNFDPSILLPNLSLTEDESKIVTSIINDARKYRDEITHKIIMGVEPLSKYDEMVENLKKMKIDEAVKAYQAALDRYNARK